MYREPISNIQPAKLRIQNNHCKEVLLTKNGKPAMVLVEYERYMENYQGKKRGAEMTRLGEGDTFNVGARRYRVEGGVPVEIMEQRGPLGGIISPLSQYVRLNPGHAFAAIHAEHVEGRSGYMVNIGGLKMALDLEQARQITVETDIPAPRPAGQRMTAAEASRLPRAIGRDVVLWGTIIAVDDNDNRNRTSSAYPIELKIPGIGHELVMFDAEITLLPEAGDV